jgi:hypothetical protein
VLIVEHLPRIEGNPIEALKEQPHSLVIATIVQIFPGLYLTKSNQCFTLLQTMSLAGGPAGERVFSMAELDAACESLKGSRD